ncbi:MAG: PadR family transcriptional regulator [Acidimicrobiia bacterium]
MGVKEGLLALLAVGPSHGYQLKLDLEAATADGNVVNVGQVYTTLQRLERDDLVTIQRTDDEGRVIYELTDTGREALGEWMRRPADLAAAGRDEISMKVLLALATGSADTSEVIATQRGAAMGLLQDYTRLRAEMDPEDLAWQLRLERMVLAVEAELRWLDRVEDRIGGTKSKTPAPGQTEAAKARSGR